MGRILFFLRIHEREGTKDPPHLDELGVIGGTVGLDKPKKKSSSL